MLKFQILLMAVLIACFAFMSCERTQQVMTPVTNDVMDADTTDADTTDADTTDADTTDADTTDADTTDADTTDADTTDADMSGDGTVALEVVTDADSAGTEGESPEENSTDQ